jgi:hypothetical protein
VAVEQGLVESKHRKRKAGKGGRGGHKGGRGRCGGLKELRRSLTGVGD